MMTTDALPITLHRPTTDADGRLILSPAELATAERLEAECRSLGLTPMRLVFRSLAWGDTIAQVQSVETFGPGSFGHAHYCAHVLAE